MPIYPHKNPSWSPPPPPPPPLPSPPPSHFLHCTVLYSPPLDSSLS